jgi:predicted membrane protein
MGNERRDKASRGGIIVGVSMGKSGTGKQFGVISGSIIALIGTVILLDNLGFHIVSHLYRFWPMILILVGVWNLACQSGRVFGVFMIIIGALFQLDTLGIAHFTWGEIWPLAIIAVGVLVMWGSVQAKKVSKVVSDATGG